MSKKVLFITGDAVESLEIYYPYYRVLEEGYEAVIASPTKKCCGPSFMILRAGTLIQRSRDINWNRT